MEITVAHHIGEDTIRVTLEGTPEEIPLALSFEAQDKLIEMIDEWEKE